MDNIAVVFSGQGSQVRGMYQSLYDSSKVVRSTIEEAEDIMKTDIHSICFDGPVRKLMEPINAHIAIVSFQVAAFRDYIYETGCAPKLCAGHSLGEFVALVCSGALQFSDALKLVKLRCEISDEICKTSDGGMGIIDGISKTQVNEHFEKLRSSEGKILYVACDNSDNQVVVSGKNDNIFELGTWIKSKGGMFTPLIGSAPFHSPLMQDGLPQLKDLLDGMEFRKFRYPVMSNYTGQIYKDKSCIKENLMKHLVCTVQWNSIIRKFPKFNINTVVDFSTNHIFAGIIEQNFMKPLSYSTLEKKQEVIKLFGQQADKEDVFLSKCLKVAVSVPNYNTSTEEYVKEVIESYHKIEELKKQKNFSEFEKKKCCKKAIDLLKIILAVKQVPCDERKWWIDTILDEIPLFSRGEVE
ncbi:ACP S-malonyltransferase [Clostridium felsineum]|uniref:ACP S-malonyltransferase n=1 Tax=Clostridium felsineum TaxID=36839 RepID=UPI00098C6B4F|nr:ACP S-malonyltransferase [Clostridium felsineum]URZ01265.1 Malonyl CoA-acyl carrier protein transacylase [Clostridium felsineum]